MCKNCEVLQMLSQILTHLPFIMSPSIWHYMQFLSVIFWPEQCVCTARNWVSTINAFWSERSAFAALGYCRQKVRVTINQVTFLPEGDVLGFWNFALCENTSGGSSVPRPGREDPHRRQWNFLPHLSDWVTFRPEGVALWFWNCRGFYLTKE